MHVPPTQDPPLLGSIFLPQAQASQVSWYSTVMADSDIHAKVEQPSNLPNLRRLFVEARTEAEESAYSRNAFYNLVLFISSVAAFSIVAQRSTAQR
ncbi:hypothetical protein KCU79_g18733, partial [Aureobasidium melanogenum]